ncbi:hypothetical protein BGZ91_000354, partial [Linnemannia elongata]
GFQLLPLTGGDVDMLHGDSGDNGTQVTETSTNLAEPTKELTEFSIDTGIQEFVIKESEYNTSRAVKDPVNSLLYDLTGKVTIIGKPTIRYLQERSPSGPVKELQEQGTRVMFVGNGSGRITRVGNEEIVFHKDLDRKVTNLPRNATPLTFTKLCNKYEDCSVTPCPRSTSLVFKKNNNHSSSTPALFLVPSFTDIWILSNVLTMTFGFPETTLSVESYSW